MKSFEDAGTEQKRRWMCFVCGKGYGIYEDYKTHIITEHEEGREYISCPACKAPVRDLKTHFKVKHPAREMPKNVQTRVGIWRDFSPNGKKKKTRKPKFITGYFESRKMGVDFRYRSRMEEQFYICLEADTDVLYFYAEPFKIPYYWQGEWHNYIPDLRVQFIDESNQIWEIKPQNQTEYDQNIAKWASASTHCQNVGWEFIVQTEKALDMYQAKIKRQNKNNS
jgi:hypothetical protein